MSNVFLPKPGSITTYVAKYKRYQNYNSKGYLTSDSKVDVDHIKVSFSDEYLKDRMSNKILKEIDFRLLDFIVCNLDKNTDIVTLNPTIIVKHIPRQKSSISESIKRLITAKYIAKLTGPKIGRCKYEINPKFYFKGNRIEYLEKIDPSYIVQIP